MLAVCRPMLELQSARVVVRIKAATTGKEISISSKLDLSWLAVCAVAVCAVAVCAVTVSLLAVAGA